MYDFGMTPALIEVRPTIFLDLDGMVHNLHAKLVEFYNQDNGTTLTELKAFTPKDENGQLVIEVYDRYLWRDNVFQDLKLLPGALQAVNELKELGHVIIVSAPSRNPDSVQAKIRLVQDQLYIPRTDIVLTKRKYLLTSGKIWLEDWHDNISQIRAVAPTAYIGAIAYPYNLKVAELLTIRAEGYADIATAWKTLVSSVETFIRSQPKSFFK